MQPCCALPPHFWGIQSGKLGERTGMLQSHNRFLVLVCVRVELSWRDYFSSACSSLPCIFFHSPALYSLCPTAAGCDGTAGLWTHSHAEILCYLFVH